MQYIATQPILELCQRSAWRPGARVSQRCWEQVGVDVEGVKKSATEAAIDSKSDSDLGREESSRASGSSGAEWSGFGRVYAPRMTTGRN